MVQNEITFENLPKAVVHLVSEVAEIKNLVCKGQTPVVPPKRIPIGIDDACKLIGKAKPTVYTLVNNDIRYYYLITTNRPYTCAMITTKIVSTTYFSFIVNNLQEYHIVVSTKLKSYKYDNR